MFDYLIENEMRPDAGQTVLKQPDSLQKPQAQADGNNGGEDMEGQDMGVLPVPGAQPVDNKDQNANGGANLDAAEDDLNLKNDFNLPADDQSPDGELHQKVEANGAMQAPDKQNDNLVAAAQVEQQGHAPFDNNL
jgi:hypothetical protein